MSDHHLPRELPTRAFAIGIALNVAYVLVEAGVGVYANSVALLADAGHNLSDVLALLLAWGAGVLARRPASQRFTYGLGSSTIWAALINAVVLLIAVGSIAWEAFGRLFTAQSVQPSWIIGVALAGVVVNGFTAAMFFHGSKRDLNLRGAFLHMAADAAVSVGVAAAGGLIILTGWLWIDPAVSLVVSALIVAGTWELLREALGMSLHSVPSSIQYAAVMDYLAALPGVSSVHDLHVWGMSTSETALTAHLVMPDGHPGDDFLDHTAEELERRFGIGHATLQIECGNASHPCKLVRHHAV
jgi:cobalt-zinc-cadmium efflux system protein